MFGGLLTLEFSEPLPGCLVRKHYIKDDGGDFVVFQCLASLANAAGCDRLIDGTPQKCVVQHPRSRVILYDEDEYMVRIWLPLGSIDCLRAVLLGLCINDRNGGFEGGADTHTARDTDAATEELRQLPAQR